VQSGLFCASTEYADLSQADTVSICVPTPLRKTKDPDMSFIIDAVNAIAKICHEGMLVVLESTTYPGTTEEIILEKLVGNGFNVGENVFVAFSPERIDPGNPKYGVRNTPKVVGGITPACTEMAAALYGKAIERVFPMTSTA